MLNLWKGFVELVHYIDENQEWLERELEVCKKLKYWKMCIQENRVYGCISLPRIVRFPAFCCVLAQRWEIYFRCDLGRFNGQETPRMPRLYPTPVSWTPSPPGPWGFWLYRADCCAQTISPNFSAQKRATYHNFSFPSTIYWKMNELWGKQTITGWGGECPMNNAAR